MNNASQMPSMPVPSEPCEAERWNHTRLRRRMLDGVWQQDLLRRFQWQMGSERFNAIGHIVDLSCNPFRNVAKAVSVLYDTKNVFRHNDNKAQNLIGEKGLLDKSIYAAIMPRFQMSTVGCRDYMMRISLDSSNKLRYRPVAPDMIIAEEYDDMPDKPCCIRELRLREIDNKCIWTWDSFSIDDPENPQYAIYEANSDGTNGKELTNVFYKNIEDLDNFKAYSFWRYADGTPFIPYVTYHAQQPGDRLWMHCDQHELVEGTLNIGVYWSHWGHVLRDCSWPQRWTLNAVPAGMSESEAGIKGITTDPATVVALETTGEIHPGMVGQWAAGGDPLVMLQAVSEYASRLAREADVPESDIQRMGGTARSGYAISLSNEGKRVAQRKYMVQFRQSDEELIAKSAAICNRMISTDFPEDNYSVVYKEIPLSPDELTAKSQNIFDLMDRGLMSQTRAYIEFNPGLTEEQANQDLKEIANSHTMPHPMQPVAGFNPNQNQNFNPQMRGKNGV